MKQVRLSVPKIDSSGLALGKAAYVDDLAPAYSIVVKMLRSPYSYAKVQKIDTSAAENVEGVVCILTKKDFPRRIFTRAGQGEPEPSPYDKFALDDYVRYIGDEVAVVAARDEKSAERALKLINIEYEKYESINDFEKAYENKVVIHPEEEAHPTFDIGYNAKKNLAASYSMSTNDVEKELSRSEVIVRSTYYTQAQAHVMMEPHACATYFDYQGRLTVLSTTQTPFHVRRILSRVLEYPMHKIRVIKPRIGGGFGGKQAIHGEVYCAAVTIKTGLPAKMVYTRREVFHATYTRHPMRIDVTIGAGKNGMINAIDFKILSDTGAYGEHALTVLMVAGSKVLPLYNKVNAVRFDGKVVYTNNTPAGAYRGYGAVQGNFALESAIDELAQKLGMNPIEIRKINMITQGETSPIFRIMGEGREGTDTIINSCKLDYCVSRGMELIGWKEKYPCRKISTNKVRSVGMAIAMQGSAIANYDMASAAIKLNDDGFFNLTIGATDLGTGSDTILAQIVADVLEVPMEKIIVYSSDTDLTPFDKGAYASSTTYASGNAVKKAAEKIKESIMEKAAEYFKCSMSQIRYSEGVIYGPDNTQISLKELSTVIYYSGSQEQIYSCASYVPAVSPPPYMAGFVEIETDMLTGKVEVIEYVAVVDCGTPINPNLAKVQVEGAIVQGIGMALYEEVIKSRSGKLLSDNMMTYHIPSRKDIGKITVEFAESYEPSGPFGAKSVGEIGIDTPPAAIANAIFNGTGKRIRKLPVTPENIVFFKEKNEY